MCFSSAESDFQGVHVCSLMFSDMSQWKWDFFQNSSQYFNISFHFFPCARIWGGGCAKITMETESESECGGYIWSSDQVVSHSMQMIICSCSRITCLNSEIYFLSFKLVVVALSLFFFFFAKGVCLFESGVWSPCVHILMLPSHLQGLVCNFFFFFFVFVSAGESHFPPEVSPLVEQTQANGLRNHSWETACARARFYWTNFGWSEVIDFTLTASRFWGLPLKAPWILRILS